MTNQAQATIIALVIKYVIAGKEFIRIAEFWTRFVFDRRVYRRNIHGQWRVVDSYPKKPPVGVGQLTPAYCGSCGQRKAACDGC